MVSLEIALGRIDTAFDAQIDAKANVVALHQEALDQLVGEKEVRLVVVQEWYQASDEKVRIDAIVANVPEESV